MTCARIGCDNPPREKSIYCSPECARLVQLERKRQWRREHAYNERTRKTAPMRQVGHGVLILYPGCALWDQVSRSLYDAWMQARELRPGTRVRIGDEERMIE